VIEYLGVFHHVGVFIALQTRLFDFFDGPGRKWRIDRWERLVVADRSNIECRSIFSYKDRVQ